MPAASAESEHHAEPRSESSPRSLVRSLDIRFLLAPTSFNGSGSVLAPASPHQQCCVADGALLLHTRSVVRWQTRQHQPTQGSIARQMDWGFEEETPQFQSHLVMIL